MKVKYFATYCGPSYGSAYSDYMDAFKSLSEAKQGMRNRQSGMDHPREYRRNMDDSMVPWSTGCRVDFPGTTHEDYMDLHEAYLQDDGTYTYSEEIAYRLTVGPRGGIEAERG